jgi:hypothetical protein
MLPLPDNPRYERKFLPQGLVLAEVLALVQRHPSVFREAYPPRYVNNIYLDSPARSDYHDHVAGAANRSKTRVRWYGAASGQISKPVLEQKLKRGHVGGKLSHGLPSFLLNGEGERRPITDSLNVIPLPETVRARLHQLEPVLFNRYRRHYFLSGDRKFRLTVDAELQFGSVAGHGGTHRLISRPAVLVVELKFATQAAPDADRVTNSLPFRLVRCSKYILGMDTLTLAAF